jgi:hypothetical protein
MCGRHPEITDRYGRVIVLLGTGLQVTGKVRESITGVPDHEVYKSANARVLASILFSRLYCHCGRLRTTWLPTLSVIFAAN